MLRDSEHFEVVIVATVRDVAYRRLLRDVEAIESALPRNSKKTWFVVESNSTRESSVEALKKLGAKKPNFIFKSLGEDPAGSRIQRIARARNEYLRFIRDSFSQDLANGVCVVADLDGLNSNPRLPEECLNEVVQLRQAHFANQHGPYYDISALRHDQWCPQDPWGDFEKLRVLLGEEIAYQLAIKSRQIRVPQDSPKIAVHSAFGGLGIYPLSALVASRATYEPVGSSGVEECEHVGFHRTLLEEGVELFINPQILNARYTEHTRYADPILGPLLRVRSHVARRLPPELKSLLIEKLFR